MATNRTAALCREIERALPDRLFADRVLGRQKMPTNGAGPTLRFLTPRAIAHVLRSPGQLGLGRDAYVYGDIETDDLDGVIALIGRWNAPPLGAAGRARPAAAATAPRGSTVLPRPPRRSCARAGDCTRKRDGRGPGPPLRRLERVLRPVPRRVDDLQLRAIRGGHETLEQVQDAKLELICAKLGLQPGQRVFRDRCVAGAVGRSTPSASRRWWWA